MTAVTIILASAALAFGLATRLRLPAVPLLIVVGILLNATAGAVNLPLARETIDDMLQLGLAFLVFAAGMELNPARIGRQRNAAVKIGLGQFAIMAIIGGGLAIMLGFIGLEAVYIALAMSASSTIVVVRILMQRRQFFEPFGRVVLGVLLLQDLLVILLIAILSGVERGVGGMAMGLIATIGLMALAYIFIRWISPWLLLRQRLDQETMLLCAVAILFLFVGIAFWTNLPTPVGAFLAGVALAAFPVNGVIRAPVNSLSNFFLALFFVALGATVTLPGPEDLMLAAALSAAVILLTPPLVVLLARRTNISTRASIESGLLLAQCSEFSIVIALLGRASGHVTDAALSVVVLVVVITMIMASFIATDEMTLRLLRLTRLLRQRLSARGLRRSFFGLRILDSSVDAAASAATGGEPREEHILLIGCGSNSRVLLDLLLLEGHEVVVVDEDPGVVKSLRGRGVEAVLGDGGDPALLKSLNARAARVVVSTMRRVGDNLRLLHHVRSASIPVLVRVFDDDEARRIKRLGGEAILESHAAADEFARWFAGRSDARTAASS